MHLPDGASWSEESDSLTMSNQLHPVRSAIWRTRNYLAKTIRHSLFHNFDQLSSLIPLKLLPNRITQLIGVVHGVVAVNAEPILERKISALAMNGELFQIRLFKIIEEFK